jgi:hypothetical protein
MHSYGEVGPSAVRQQIEAETIWSSTWMISEDHGLLGLATDER